MKTRQEVLEMRDYLLIELEESILPWVEKYNKPYEITDVDFKEVCYNSTLDSVEAVKQEIERQQRQIDSIEKDIERYNRKFSREIEWLFNRELTLDETIHRMYYIKYDEGFDYNKMLKSSKSVVETLKGQVQWMIDNPEWLTDYPEFFDSVYCNEYETIDKKKEQIVKYEKEIEKLNHILECEYGRIRDILTKLINYEMRIDVALDELYTYTQEDYGEYKINS